MKVPLKVYLHYMVFISHFLFNEGCSGCFLHTHTFHSAAARTAATIH